MRSLGWQPRIPLDAGLRSTYAEFLNWVRATLPAVRSDR
jgi:nucleoside-diphosphate-sugar epimerase